MPQGEEDESQIDKKMDNVIANLKKNINSGAVGGKATGRGRFGLTIETEEEPPLESERNTNKRFDLNIDLINDSYAHTERRIVETPDLLFPSKSPTSTIAKGLPFSPNSLFMPRSKNGRALL